MTDLDRAALAEVEADLERWAEQLERFKIKAAMETAFHAGQVGNRYFNESAPFNTRKTDMERCGHGLGVSLQIVRMLCLMLAPVIPFGMEKVWGWLGMETELWRGGWEEGCRPLPPGRSLGRPEILYPRLDEEAVQAEIDRLQRMIDE